MNNFETNTNGALANATPLFGSVWLALFHVLRKNYYERRLAIDAITEGSHTIEKK